MPEFMHVEHDPEGQAARMLQLQGVMDRIAGQYAGTGDSVPVQAAIEEAVAAAGLPEQPAKWTTDCAAEIAAGRTVVVDRGIQSLPQLATPPHRDPGD